MSHPAPADDRTVTITDPSPELDVREIAKPQRHPLIFRRFDALAVGESFVLVNGHDPLHLREEFEREHPGAYDWQYLTSGERVESGPSPRLWRIRITRRTASDLPRVLGDTVTLLGSADGAPAAPADAVAGAVWTLQPSQRQLDANVIRLAALASIQRHIGPDLDVLLHVLDGAGELVTETGVVGLSPGALVWLPRRSERSIAAGPDGLSYLSVHTRRPALTVGSPGH